MKRVIRGALVALASLCALGGLASQATALTIDPVGEYTAISDTVVFDLNGVTPLASCRSSSLPVALARDGSGTIARGSAAFTDCITLFSTVTIAQTADATVAMTLAPTTGGGTRIGFVVTIPRDGMQVTIGGCVFTVGGTVTLEHQYRETTLPFTLSTTDEFPIVAADLVVGSATSCVFGPGDPVGLGGGYTLSRGMVIDG